MEFRYFLLVVLSTFFTGQIFAADGKTNAAGYEFEDVIVLPTNEVENQHRTSTCWSFSGLSFLESEMLRMGKPEVDLSEMFIVWHTYAEKAEKYVRMHGKLNFSPGGAFHDVTNVIREYGIIPESAYDGLKYGEKKHVHGEMDEVLHDYVEAVVENRNQKLSTVWHEGFELTLNSYLGEIPNKFEFRGETFTPQSFAENYVGLNMNDYVEVTSYSHHPFYSKFIIEVPDNWSWDEVYNVPLDDFEAIFDYSLNNGYTIAWAADVSEDGFKTTNKGIAVLPAAPEMDMSSEEIDEWESLPEDEKEAELYKLESPVPEKEVTQEMRQIAFDNFQTTDDHGMHIFGYAKDQNGNIFYKVKNSWGDYNDYDGYFYASKPYVKYKTMSIMVHKDAIPQEIKDKLELR